jgi:phenylalanyl-tRNA synthetase alpha chain
VCQSLSYVVLKGPKYAKAMPVEHADLTSDMLQDGSWKTANFKPYNFAALGVAQEGGALHPLNKVRSEFREIFFNMGFIEMPTQRFVESSFWNFDALFVPQQHPARDQQDTFFISDPPVADRPRDDPQAEKVMLEMERATRKLYVADGEVKRTKPRDYEQYWKDVKRVHQEGGFGSVGYRYPYDEEETLRLVLRTHTTAVSTWVLHRLAEDPRPARYFSIGTVPGFPE